MDSIYRAPNYRHYEKLEKENFKGLYHLLVTFSAKHACDHCTIAVVYPCFGADSTGGLLVENMLFYICIQTHP